MIDGEAPKGSAKAEAGTGDKSGLLDVVVVGEDGSGYEAGSFGFGGGNWVLSVWVWVCAWVLVLVSPRELRFGERGRLDVAETETEGVSFPNAKLLPPPPSVLRNRAEAGAGAGDADRDDPPSCVGEVISFNSCCPSPVLSRPVVLPFALPLPPALAPEPVRPCPCP